MSTISRALRTPYPAQVVRVQYRRAHQSQRRDALRMLGDEAMQIGEATASKIPPSDAKMVRQFGEVGLD